MIFPKSKAYVKKINENLEVFEYCNMQEHGNLDMDGAIAHFKSGSFGPKINKGFTELFFILEGELEIDLEGKKYNLKKGDLFILPRDKKYTLYGHCAKIFISCSPPFDPKNIEFV